MSYTKSEIKKYQSGEYDYELEIIFNEVIKLFNLNKTKYETYDVSRGYHSRQKLCEYAIYSEMSKECAQIFRNHKVDFDVTPYWGLLFQCKCSFHLKDMTCDAFKKHFLSENHYQQLNQRIKKVMNLNK